METATSALSIPRLAFAGTGWIGLNRLSSLVREEICIPAGINDPDVGNAARAAMAAPGAKIFNSFEELLNSKPDGVVIASPNSLHADQCIMALKRGIPVFCQKPLARDARESKKVIDAARENNLLLGVDLSYRHSDGINKIYRLAHEKELGKIFAADLVFHNAYGPDKAWFYNPELSGGGCLIDLGIHLADLALWIMDFPRIKFIRSVLLSKSRRVTDISVQTEDYVTAQLETVEGCVIRLTCSWNLDAGKDADINASFYGTNASATFYNVNGSFYDFESALCHGTSQTIISSPPDDWGGRALIKWVKRLSVDKTFDNEINSYLMVAETIDRIYGKVN